MCLSTSHCEELCAYSPAQMQERQAIATPLPIGVAPPAWRARQAHSRHRRRRRRVLAAAGPHGTRCACAIPAAPARPRRRAAVAIVRRACAVAGGRARAAPVARAGTRAALGSAVIAGRVPVGDGRAARAASGVFARPIALALSASMAVEYKLIVLCTSELNT